MMCQIFTVVILVGNDYWGKRLADKAFDRTSEGMLKELKKIYRNQSKDIQDKVTDLYLKMIEDGGISTTNLYAYGRYTELIREINTILQGYGGKEIEIVSGGLESAYKEAFSETSETLGQSVKWGLQNTYIMEEVVNANLKGANFSKRIWNNRSSLLQTLEKNIQDVVASGQSKDKAIKSIMGIEKASFRNADRLVRTETMRVINDGQKQSFTANGYTHGYYIYSDDDRNCEECERISKESRRNPLLLDSMEAVHHPNCRCTIRPVVSTRTAFDIAKQNGEQAKYEAALAKSAKGDIINQSGKSISATGANKFDKGFTEANLMRHFMKHGSEYPKMTDAEYNEYALKLIQQPVTDDILGYKTSGGAVVRYKVSTNDFVKGYPEGGIASMYKPKGDATKGYRYFEKLRDEEGFLDD